MGAVVHQEAAFDLSGVDEVQGAGFFRAQEHQGVVGLGNEIPDFQGVQAL